MQNTAKWISIPDDTKCDCPEFKRKIIFEKKIKKAVLYVSAIGVYECRIDGKKIGCEVLTPGWTNYADHVQYREYDITDILQDESELAILCGKGWAVGRMGWDNEDNVYSKKILCMFSLSIDFEDGTTKYIVSDKNTEVWTSYTQFSDIYHGETIDRTVTPKLLGYGVECSFSTRLVPQMGAKIVENEIIHPVRYIVTPAGEKVIDFGQNLTGYVKIKINAKSGEKISFRHAEILDKDGNFYTANLRKARNEIHYVCGGGDEVFKPSLSFQGFRYICLDEYPYDVDLSCFTAIEVHSDIKRTGNFVCGYDKLNMLYSNIVWGQKDNFLDIPTDCPQRDERLGWTGDAQVFARTAAINFNVEQFFEKWLCDLRSEQHNDGSIPAVIPDCLRQFQQRISAAWADSAVIVPWEMYRAYGNKKILEDNFECMCKWIEYMHNAGDEEYLWIGGDHYGDWLAMDIEGSMEGATDTDLIASCYFAYSTSLLIKAGKVIEKDVSVYEMMYPRIVEAIKTRFLKNGLPISRTQTACVLLIHFGLCDDKERVGSLLIKLIEEYGGRLTTGFVGTPYLLHALSETGHTDMAYELLLCEGYPSWLYSVNHGATTMWEHWDGIKEDGSFWDTSMNSYNHYAYGSVFDWMFAYIGGVDINDGGEGYSNITITPVPDKRLGFADTEIETAYGKIISKWSYREDFIRYEITVPDGVNTEIKLRDGQQYNISGGKHIFYTEDEHNEA